MTAILLVARRELKAYVRSPLGYVMAAAVLMGTGLWFIVRAMGAQGEKRLSAQVLAECFNGLSGGIAIACLVMAMRLVAYESEHGTLVLLRTAPISDRDVVLGKFLSVLFVTFVLTLLTAYMPALIFVNGRVSLGHIATGYLGIMLLGSAVSAIGLFGSALAKNQVLAFIISGALTLVMYLLWLVAKVSEPPVADFVEGMALHHMRQRDFMTGVLRLENVVFYLVVTFVFLFGAIKTLEARRWR